MAFLDGTVVDANISVTQGTVRLLNLLNDLVGDLGERVGALEEVAEKPNAIVPMDEVSVASPFQIIEPFPRGKFILYGYDIAVSVASGNIEIRESISASPAFIIPALAINSAVTMDISQPGPEFNISEGLFLSGAPLQLLSGTMWGRIATLTST